MARLSCEKIKSLASHLSISTRQATHTGKSHSAAEFLWRMQLQIQYIAAKLTPHVYVPEDMVNSMLMRLQDVIRREGNPTMYLARGLYTQPALFRAKIVLIKS
jgi:hypothetical protein